MGYNLNINANGAGIIQIYAPDELQLSVISETRIDLSWTDNSNNENGFSIERSTNGIDFSEIDTVSTDVTTYQNTGLTAGTLYYYRVRAYIGGLYSAYSNIASKYAYSLTQFETDLTAAGIWAKLDYVNLSFIGADAYKNIITDTVKATLQNGAQLEDNVGFYGGHGTAHVAYNFDPQDVVNNFALNSAYIAMWNWKNIDELGVILGGTESFVGFIQFTLRRWDNNESQYGINNTVIKDFEHTERTDEFYSYSKSNDTIYIRRNNSLIETGTVVTTAIPSTFPVGLANQNQVPAIGSVSQNKQGAVIFGEYLTESEDLILYTSLTKLISASANYPEYYETDYIQYKSNSIDNVKVIAGYGDDLFGVTYNKIWFSENAGESWDYSLIHADARKIDFAYIWDNGDIVFSNRNIIYRSTNKLTSISEVSPKYPNGDPYSYHTPANANWPGNYYRRIETQKKFYRDGQEILLWGNYTNVDNGASPVNVYEMKNNGADLTVIYEFGQNPYYRDDGTDDGGTTGTLLGDAGNSIKTRHVHSVTWDEDNSTLYLCTGDQDRADPFFECHWLKAVYSDGNYTFSVIKSTSANSNYKSVGLNIVGNYMYYAVDYDNVSIKGVWKGLLTELDDSSKHTRLLSSNEEIISLFVQDDAMIATEFSTNLLVWTSNDGGDNWNQSNMTKLPGYSGNWGLFPITRIIDQWVLYNQTNNISIFIQVK